MTETVYSMRAGRQLDQARVAEARAQAAERQAVAEVARAQAAAQVAGIQRDAERAARAAAEAERAEARERRRERWAGYVSGVRARRDLTVVMGVMVASVGTAWPAQMGFYLHLGMHPLLAVLVTAMTEGAAWAGAAMASRAIEDDRPAGLYRFITWTAALVAAGLNVAHSWGTSPLLAFALGVASILGVGLWEAYAHSRAAHAEGRSGEEIRREVYRRLRFRKVSRKSRDLLAAVPGLTADAAWIVAWRAVYGADPGVTRRGLKLHHKRARAVNELLAEADEFTGRLATVGALATPAATLTDLAPGGSVVDSAEAVAEAVRRAFDAARPVGEILGRLAGEDAGAGSRTAREGAASSQVTPNNPPFRSDGSRARAKAAPAVRELARQTARASDPDDRARARAWVAARRADGVEVTWQQVAKKFRRGETWARTRLNEVNEAPALRVVDGGDA